MRLDRLVAIEVLSDLVGGEVVRDRFLREARAAARLSHPSIVPIYAADDRAGVTFLVMAFVDGPPHAVGAAAGEWAAHPRRAGADPRRRRARTPHGPRTRWALARRNCRSRYAPWWTVAAQAADLIAHGGDTGVGR